MKATVKIYDQDGNKTGTEEIEILELGEYKERQGEGMGYIATITEVGVICSDKVHMDDVVATLDNIYGYFKYKII